MDAVVVGWLDVGPDVAAVAVDGNVKDAAAGDTFMDDAADDTFEDD